LIRRALKAPEGFASPSINARLRNTRRGFFAAVLDDFRDMARASPPLARSQRNFRGVRAHLDRLARWVRAPTDESDWNTWRKRQPHIHPDLRGVNLASLHLQQLNLDSVRLDHANLALAQLGQGHLDRAHLRRTRWEGTRLSYASQTGEHCRCRV